MKNKKVLINAVIFGLITIVIVTIFSILQVSNSQMINKIKKEDFHINKYSKLQKESTKTIGNFKIVEDTYITNIKSGTKVNEFKNNIASLGSIEIYDKNSQSVDGSSNLTTGMIVKVNNEIQYRIAVIADLNGDGKLTTVDLSKLIAHLNNSEKLNNEYEQAADLNNDNNITEKDLELIRLCLVGFDIPQNNIEEPSIQIPEEYNGFNVVGLIEIPETSVKNYILSEATKKALETSVAFLYGPGINKTGNTVITGHNYKNGTFFSNNKMLSVGDIIYITDKDGNKVKYTIYKKFEAELEDTSYAFRETNGNTEITLVSENDDLSMRLVIYARTSN